MSARPRTRPATHAVVCLPALDLRGRADHRSELKSQLLVGEIVKRVGSSADGRWWKVVNLTDGYRGWARVWGLVGVGASRAAAWKRRARSRVKISYAEVTTEPGTGALVSPLFWSGRVISGGARRGHRRIEMPDGRRGWAPARAIAPSSAAPPAIADRVRSLLGVPYLWGGRTPMGIDCSAFTQLVLAEQGVSIPRDAREQFRAVVHFARPDLAKEGDLFFFGAPRTPVGHVGLALGGGYFAHARGRVRVNSMDPGNPLFDKELNAQFRGAGRPGSGVRTGGSRGSRRAESA